MKVILSISNAMARWLKVSPPRIPSADGKRIGTQALRTDTTQIAWQCQMYKHGPRQKPYFTVIAVEAYSRYALFMPFEYAPTEAEFEHLLLERWGNESLHLALESGAVSDDELQFMVEAFTHNPVQIEWVSNTDPSVNGHVADASQWLLQSLDAQQLDFYSSDECFGLGLHINKLQKRVGPKPNTPFRPMARMLDDTLYRFASGLSPVHYHNTKVGDFPCPYPAPPKSNNVVQLADFRRASSGSDKT